MTFPIRFLICNLCLGLLLGGLLALKKLLKRHLTASAQYHLWYVFMFALLLPFIPRQSISLVLTSSSGSDSAILDGATHAFTSTSLYLEDFSIEVSSSRTLFNTVSWTLWISGMLLTSLHLIYIMIKTYHIRKNAYPITEETENELYCQYLNCKKELHIGQKIPLYASCGISSPVSYGLFRPKVLIPQDLDILLSKDDIRFIFLHELQHHKHKDALLNSLFCLLQIVYWFNPLIWYSSHQLQKDREFFCDYAVLRTVGKEQSCNYGYTLLKYAQNMQKGMFLSPLSSLGGGSSMIRQRIIKIADYKKDTVWLKLKSTGMTCLLFLLVFSASPVLTAVAAPDDTFSLTEDNWEPIDVSSYFAGIDGSFVLYDMANDNYQIYNKDMSVRRISPDSTYKIYSGLFALEENVISPDASLQKWNGSEQPFNAWNQDQTLDTAMENSVNWYFQNLDRKVGLSALSSYYHMISYGNCDISGGIKNYWAESSLKISPAEQVNLLSAFLRNDWGFQPENIQAVKDSLLLSETPDGSLYGKTGTGSPKHPNGWFIGFYETAGNTYCFATNLQGTQDATGSNAAEITITILNELIK